VKELKKIIEANIEKSGDVLLSWKKENIFVIIRSSIDKQGIIIQNDDEPIVQYKIDPGSSIHVMGKFNCKSDAPKQCFKNLFNPEKKITHCDYFHCGQCNLNWLCKSCAEVCHKGHNGIIPTMANHSSSWACCYCSKKGHSCELLAK